MNTRTSQVFRNLFWAVLAAVLLYFSFRGVDWKNFRDVLNECKWALVLMAMAAGVLSFIFRACRWKLLLMTEEPGTQFVDCYDGFTIGRICDLVIPHVGEFVRCGYVLSPRLTYDKALGTVVLERIWDILMLVLATVLLLVFKWADFGSFFMEKVLGPVSGRLDFNFWWLLVFLSVVAGTGVLAVLTFRSQGRVFSKVRRFSKGVWSGLSSCMKMHRKGLFLFFTLMMWLMFLFMSWFIIQALPSDFGFTLVDALFIMLVGSIAGIVPVPGGFGAFHYLVAIALQAVYSVPFETGIIFATLSHESQTVTMILCGLVSYCHQTFFRSEST